MLTHHEADIVDEARSRRRRAGVTLIELAVVLLILVALAAVAVPLVSDESSAGRSDSTRTTLVNLRTAVTRYWNDRVLTNDTIDPDLQASKRLLHVFDHVGEGRQDTPQLVWLMLNPISLDRTTTFNATYKLGWNGPYMSDATGSYSINALTNFTNRYGNNGDAAFLDGWGRAIVIQNPGTMSGVQDVRLVSAGPNGVLNINPATFTDALEAAPTLIGDDIYVSFQLR